MRRTLTGGLINLYGSTKKYRKIRAGTDPDPTRSILIKNCQTDDYGPLRPGTYYFLQTAQISPQNMVKQ